MFFLDRRNDKIIINSHTSGGIGVRTLVMTSDLIISTFYRLSWILTPFILIHAFHFL